MPTEKYILAKNCRVLPKAEIQKIELPNTQEVEDIIAGKMYIIEVDKNWHLINPTIKQFLEAFAKPTTLNQVIAQFAQLAECHTYEIRIKMTAFFEAMLDRALITTCSQQYKDEVFQQNQTRFHEDQQVGVFQIKSEIFEKSEVRIYLALDQEAQQLRVLKFLKPSRSRSKEQIKERKNEFLQEFKLMQEINGHINICQCFGYISSPKHCYGILEYIEGENLRHFIKKQQPTLDDRIRLIGEILSAMSYVHQRKVLHGDIHLSNFIVENSSQSIKLIDFNLSNRELPQKDEIIREGGVFQYIPPEKVDDRAFHLVKERSDYSSEVFQLGVVIYYILYERMPFEAFSWQVLAQMICQEDPTFSTVTSTGTPIPKALISILKKSLNKEPAKRYSSAQTFFLNWGEISTQETSISPMT